MTLMIEIPMSEHAAATLQTSVNKDGMHKSQETYKRSVSTESLS